MRLHHQQEDGHPPSCRDDQEPLGNSIGTTHFSETVVGDSAGQCSPYGPRCGTLPNIWFMLHTGKPEFLDSYP